MIPRKTRYNILSKALSHTNVSMSCIYVLSFAISLYTFLDIDILVIKFDTLQVGMFAFMDVFILVLMSPERNRKILIWLS